MFQSLNEFNQYVNSAKEQDVAELRKLRMDVYQLLQSVDKQLDLVDNTKHISKKRCPKCNSCNIRVHAKNPVARFRCIDCNYTFSKSQSPLYYRRKRTKNNQSAPGLLEFIMVIYQTNKSISEVEEELNISRTTYYEWRKTVLEILPQLKEHFDQRRKKVT